MFAHRPAHKPALLLVATVLATVFHASEAALVDTEAGDTSGQAEPHDLARAVLLERAMACEDELCLERELDEEAVAQAVRAAEVKIATSSRGICCFTDCYYRHCKSTCNWWAVNGRVPGCCRSNFIGGSCRVATSRVAKEPADAAQDERGGDADADSATGCYNPGERSQGAAGHPRADEKPCCDGQDSVEVSGEWGKFCPGGVGGGAALPDGQRRAAAMAPDAIPAAELGAVRTTLSDLTKGCVALQKGERRNCMQETLDTVLVNVARVARRHAPWKEPEEEDPYRFYNGFGGGCRDCPNHDSSYYCMCASTCRFWLYGPNNC